MRVYIGDERDDKPALKHVHIPHAQSKDLKKSLKGGIIWQLRLNKAINLMRQSFNKVKVKICIHTYATTKHKHSQDHTLVRINGRFMDT